MKAKLIIVLLSFSATELPAQNIYMGLSANGESTVVVYTNEPVVLRLCLSNPAAISAFEWNQSAKRRITELEDSIKNKSRNSAKHLQEKKDIEQKLLKPDSIKLGTEAMPWYSAISWSIESKDGIVEKNLPVKQLLFPQVNPMIILDAGQQHSICYGIDNIGGALTDPGQYTLRARLGNTFSNSITLTLQGKPMPATVASTPETLLRLGNYFLQTGNTEKAMEYANNLLKTDAISLPAQILMADGFYQGKQYEKAAAWYEKAYQQYYKKYGSDAEPPEYLLIMMGLANKDRVSD